MSCGVKKTLYQQVIVPTVTYGAETWGLMEAERRRLNVLEIKCLRPRMDERRWPRKVKAAKVEGQKGRGRP